MRSLILIPIVACLLAPTLVQGAQWLVERDGTGDFTVIQDAVDAAESGDTILLGPGRFSETSDFDYHNGATVPACVVVEKSLTFIGSGQGVSIVGPVVKNEYDTYGFGSISDNLVLTIKNLTIQDCDGVSIFFDMASPNGQLVVEDVQADNAYSGAVIKGTTGSLLSHFSINAIYPNLVGGGVTIYGGVGTQISNCDITTIGGVGINIQFSSSRDISILGCTIQGGRSGILISHTGSVLIQDCTIFDSFQTALNLTAAEGVRIDNVSACGGMEFGASINGNPGLEITNSIFCGSVAALVFQYYSTNMVFRNNHILPEPGAWHAYVTSVYDGPPVFYDMAHNYWGTTDPEELSNNIHDGYDDETRPIFIDFEPMADAPVSTSRSTLDGLKALYR